MKKPLVVHPFFFAVFPILVLYAHNVRIIPVPLSELVGPLAVSLGCAAVIFFALKLALKNPAKAGLLGSLLVLWFLSFGHIAGLVAVWTGGIFKRSFFFATGILAGLAAFLIVRSRRDFSGSTRVLNIISAALVIFNLASIGQTLVRRPRVVLPEKVDVSRPTAERPDIYYIVLDAYTRADILQEVFSFDNSSFLSDLKARGFVIADHSYANYNLTYQSLASTLNFTYLDHMARDIGEVSSDYRPLYSMIGHNRVMPFLKSHGYRVFCTSSSLKPGDIEDVDRFIPFERSGSEFRSALLNTTPFPLFIRFGAIRTPYDAHRANILHVFRVLGEFPLLEGPVFFFVHLMSPHPPFVFGPNGEPVEPGYPFSLLDADRVHGPTEEDLQDYIVRYRDQLAFINRKVLEAIDSLLSRSQRRPLIILQGDHGSRAYADLDTPETSRFKENLAILNAYLLPDDGRKQVYPQISPVNTFRLIFDRYFGTSLGFLKDRSFWTTWQKPYRFIPFDQTSHQATEETLIKAKGAAASIIRKK